MVLNTWPPQLHRYLSVYSRTLASCAPTEALTSFEYQAYLSLPTHKQGNRLAGRVAAKTSIKRFLLEYDLEVEDVNIEIINQPNGAPICRVDIGVPVPEFSISISHTNECGAAALLPGGGGGRIGVDIERVRTFSDTLINAFLTKAELVFISAYGAADRSRFIALYWSAKESYMKATHKGFAIHPRTLQVLFDGETKQLSLYDAGNSVTIPVYYDMCFDTYVITGVTI